MEMAVRNRAVLVKVTSGAVRKESVTSTIVGHSECSWFVFG